MPEILQFEEITRPPSFELPPGACDSQVHIFGDPEKFPVQSSAVYTAFNATAEAMLKMHQTLGIERGVIVQSTAYGTDHSALVAGLEIAGDNYIGCARVDDSVSDAELLRLHGAGVRGARFNFHPKLKASTLGLDEIRRTAERVAPLGWYIQLQMVDLDPAEVAPLFDGIDTRIIIDHMGPIQYPLGVTEPRFQYMLNLLDLGNWWVMLSNGHKRAGAAGCTWDDAVTFAQAYIAHAPERMIWASDWPHPLHPDPVPNDGELVDLLGRYAPDRADLERILVSNPEQLFGFGRQTRD